MESKALLALPPGSMTGPERSAAGLTPGSVRLSVGLEEEVDLKEDLARALDGL